jgi:hypothetical protein
MWKFKQITKLACFVTIWSNFARTCICAPSTFTPNFGSVGLQIRPRILENQLCHITPELIMAGFSIGLLDRRQWPRLKREKMFSFFYTTKNHIFAIINRPTLHLSSPMSQSPCPTSPCHNPHIPQSPCPRGEHMVIFWVSSNILFRSVGFATLCIALVF